MHTVCDEIADLAKTLGISQLSSSGQNGDQWILADFIDVIVHVFSPEARSFYDLDNLWGDAKKVAWLPPND